MENSQSDSNMFSVRIVSIDYYMSSPIPDFDICYSSFQGEKVNEVPVIRIYGSTPAGQKTCLHVHTALPYLYVPCSKIIQTSEEGDRYTREMSIAIEKALNSKVKSATGSKRQHVHGCSLIRARKFYGFHPSEELFVKIYLYYPHEVARLPTLLLDGAVLDRSFQPHESHIPYLLQSLIVNQQFKMYSSLSQTRSDVRMVQSLVPIWKEEYERTGMHEKVTYSEPSKPLPENVLKMLSHGPEYEDALMDMFRVAENQTSYQNTPTEEAERFLQSIRSLADVGSLCDSGICES